MKLRNLLLIGISSLCMLSVSAKSPKKAETSLPYKIVNNTVVFETPKRVQGQKSALQLRTAPIDTVRVAFIGLGMRGPGAVERFMFIDGTKVTALCDLYPDRVEKAQKILTSHNRPKAAEYSGEDGWKALCERDDIDLIYIVTPWLLHTKMATYAMEHGKHVAIEVPAAQTLKECWELVDVSERTQRHCMMLENCVYDFFEMTTLNMAQQGVFGELMHVEGSYIHNLEQFWDYYQGNWRLDYDQKHRGDVYSTHGMGPACQLLNIHRGDKMNTLVSMDTKSVVGLEVAKKKMGVNTFANGDHTITLIRTDNEKLIEMQHNVYDPRPYSRMYQVTGTKGFANKYPVEGYAIQSSQVSSDIVPDHEKLNTHSFVSPEMQKALTEKYKPVLTQQLEDMAKKVGGHGGMDFILDYRLIYCLRHGLALDQDVYDAAEWSCVGELSGTSLSLGSIPVQVPDFTRGDWNKVKGFHYEF